MLVKQVLTQRYCNRVWIALFLLPMRVYHDDHVTTPCQVAIRDAVGIANVNNQSLVVGLTQLPDGTGRFEHVPEAAVRGLTSFIPGWLVTPEGDITIMSPTRDDPFPVRLRRRERQPGKVRAAGVVP